jgi:adenylate kinase family enzyme
MMHPKSILIAGPTGAGKTPLGQYLARHGLHRRHCIHFDFGQILRETALAAPLPLFLKKEELSIILNSLKTGALLEDADFPIAIKLLNGFIENHVKSENDRLLLNGLPRHLGQAKLLCAHVNIVGIIFLDCNGDVARQRIQNNTGGDRMGRRDDSRDLILRKMDIFLERTLPLLEYYKNRGVAVYSSRVTALTSPRDISRQLEAMPEPGVFT